LGDFGTFVLQKSLYKFIGFSFVAKNIFDGYVTIKWVIRDKNCKYQYYDIGVERWVNMEINNPTFEPYLEDL
jgi:hypothetical protein